MKLKTKTGEKITFKEALVRFKKGLDMITPIQKLENETRGTFITLLGFIVAFIAVIIMREKIGLLSYGLMLIFLGSIITTGLKWLALRQQLKFFKDTETNSITDLDYLFDSQENKTSEVGDGNTGSIPVISEDKTPDDNQKGGKDV
jgi:hypothetical protein